MITSLLADRSAQARTTLTELRPPHADIGSGPTLEAIAMATARLAEAIDDSASGRVLFSLRSLSEGGRVVTHLGLGGPALDWLCAQAGDAYARLRRTELAQALRVSEDILPPEPSEQIRMAATALGGPTRLSVMPMGLGAGNGSGLAYSHDLATGAEGMTGSFRREATGVRLLSQGGRDIAPLGSDPTTPWHADLVDALGQDLG